MPEQIKWHRLAGLVLQPLFDQLGCETEIEVDLSLKEQRIDIIVVQKEEGRGVFEYVYQGRFSAGLSAQEGVSVCLPLVEGIP